MRLSWRRGRASWAGGRVAWCALVGAAIGTAPTEARAAPGVSFSQSSVSFSPPDIMVGLRSGQPQIRITSTGDRPLRIAAVALDGPHAADFRSSGCVAAAQPVILRPGAWCDVQVQFIPTAVGARTATLVVHTDDPLNPTAQIPLSGTATPAAPRLSVAPGALDFGRRAPNTSSAPQRITVVNTGVVATTTLISVDDPTAYQVTHTCGLLDPAILVGPSSQCDIDVVFRPPGSGSRPAQLSIAPTPPLPPVVVSLSGAGTFPGMSVSPSPVDFGTVLVGTAKSLAVLVKNTTPGTVLTVTAATVQGWQASEFSVVPGWQCGAVLGGASCQITVVFQPLASGVRATGLVLTSNAGGGVIGTISTFGTGRTWAFP